VGLGKGDLDFGQFLELIPDAIVVIDQGGEIVVVNTRAEELFGYPRVELLGGPLSALVPERFDASHARHQEEYFADPRNRPMGIGLKLFGRRKDGSEFPADVSISAIETSDGKFGAAAVRDLTDRNQSEKERQVLEAEAREGQARRLESIGELAGGIAHDFNNLLAVILNNTELAIEGVPEDSELRQELGEVYDAAEYGSKLTRQLLIFSKREVANREAVDLNEITTEMGSLLRRSLGERIDFDMQLADDLPRVMGDPSQLEQVLMNLVINARDAMPEGGRLGIETAVVELDADYTQARPDVVPGKYVRLTVADTGAGMSPEVVSRAFEPFFTTKSKGEGTGLGLATVYGIANQSGGNVAIYSEEGKGTVIRVHLPLAEDPEAAVVRDTGDDAVKTGHDEVVLVVEDAERVRRTVCRILTRNGYRVVETSRATQALKMLEKDNEIAIVLTDVVMPGMLGSVLGERLKVDYPDLPVLYMSGYSDVASPIEDGSKLIEKPFTSKELLRRVREELEGESAA